MADDAEEGLEALPPACALRTNHFRYDRRTQQLPLTWVRVPAGALQNGTHFKYASDASRFRVNRYQPRLFVAKRKKRLEALPPAYQVKFNWMH